MPRAARAQVEPTAASEPLTALEEATAEHERAEAALARAQTNLTEARRRRSVTEAGIETAAQATRKASLALAEDPEAEGLLDDSVMELTRLQNRLKALDAQTIPAAEIAVAGREAELETARKAFHREALRDAVQTVIAPADRRFIAAARAAAEAYRASLQARNEVRNRGICPVETFHPSGALTIGALSLAVPNDLAQLTTAQVTYSQFAGQPPAVNHPVTGGDLLGFLAARFGLDPADLKEEPHDQAV